MRQIRLGLIALVAVAAAVALFAWMSTKMNQEDDDTLTITEADIAVLRTLPVIWSPVESGAPAIYEPEKKSHADVDVYRHAMRAAEVFVQLAELAPGRYAYDSTLPEETASAQPFIEHHYAEVRGNHVIVDVTEDHLKLVRAANTGVFDDGGFDIGVEIHPKRPYGDMTYFELDMGAILRVAPEGPPRKDKPGHLDFSQAQLQRFAKLHEQTQPVLQVLLQRGTLAPGRFVRSPSGYGYWKRM